MGGEEGGGGGGEEGRGCERCNIMYFRMSTNRALNTSPVRSGAQSKFMFGKHTDLIQKVGG